MFSFAPDRPVVSNVVFAEVKFVPSHALSLTFALTVRLYVGIAVVLFDTSTVHITLELPTLVELRYYSRLTCEKYALTTTFTEVVSTRPVLLNRRIE